MILTKEIKAQLYERIRSPLVGTFALSWVAWNHRPILAFFSDMSFKDKLEYFDVFYYQYPVNYGVLFPLGSAILFILIYPYPARWIYTYSATQQNKLKAVQVQIEDKTP